MLDDGMKAQLQQYLGYLRRPVEITAALDDGADGQALRALLADVAAASSQVRVVELTGDDRDLGAGPGLSRRQLGDVVGPEHGEVGRDQLVAGRQVQPDLEELERVGAVGVEEREHLAVDHAATGGEPLGVALAEPGGRTE